MSRHCPKALQTATAFLHAARASTVALMKDHQAHPQFRPQFRRRIPAFHPVPVSPRQDGWTPERQAQFIGYLAETRCVTQAASRVGMDKTSAYRLRKREGAAGFVSAWDAALGRAKSSVCLSSAKSTGISAGERYRSGLAQVVMHRGRYVRTLWKCDENALLQFLAQLSRRRIYGA